MLQESELDGWDLWSKNSIRSFRYWTLDPQDLECALLDFEFIYI